MSHPWRDEATLRRLYWDEGLTQREVAAELGCSVKTVQEWMVTHAIPRREGSIKAIQQRDATPWRDKATLRRLYWDEEMTLDAIGAHFGVSPRTIHNWMDKHAIPRRTREEWNSWYPRHYCPYRVDRGTPGWLITSADDPSTRIAHLAVHRLVAIAEGADPHAIFSGDYHVHHINNIPFDNRPSNLAVVRHEEHSRLHHRPYRADTTTHTHMTPHQTDTQNSMTDTPDPTDADADADAENGYVRLKVRVTRGTGVRDADEITGELVVPNLEAYKDQLPGFRDSLRAEAELWRQFQPRDEAVAGAGEGDGTDDA